jgi:hypothetical protein
VNEEEIGANYFNYFTEVEEHFQRMRGTGLFLLSPLDWALIESWKNQQIPLPAVLRGIENSFAKSTRKLEKRGARINSIAFCAQAVEEEAKIAAGAAPARPTASAPFEQQQLAEFLQSNATKLAGRFPAAAQALTEYAAQAGEWMLRLEELEQRLTALEDGMLATARAAMTPEQLLQSRQDLESQLRPYRGKMTTPQLAMLEKQFLDRRIFEEQKIPRLSLFYLG